MVTPSFFASPRRFFFFFFLYVLVIFVSIVGYTSLGTGTVVTVASTGALLGASTWYHLAVDKDLSGKIRLYKNGVMVGSATPANSAFAFDAFNDQIHIGSAGLHGGAALNGWIDELRITKGICRYGSDGGFAVPTSAYPRGEP